MVARFYIDAFNLYHAIHDSGQNHLKWLNLQSWAEATYDYYRERGDKSLPSRDDLKVEVHWFSAWAEHTSREAQLRHRLYHEALRAVGVKTHMSNFKKKSVTCKVKHCGFCGAQKDHLCTIADCETCAKAKANGPLCGCLAGGADQQTCREFTTYQERESDVALGVHLVRDVIRDNIRIAFIVTRDSDLAAAVRMATSENSKLPVILILPPRNMPAAELVDAATRKWGVPLSIYAEHLLPAMMNGLEKQLIFRPAVYDPPEEAPPAI